MNQSDLSVDLRRNITHINLIRVLSPAFQLENKDLLKLNIHLSEKFLHSDNLLIIASCVNYLRNRGIMVNISVTGENTYASRVNFYRLINIPFEEAFIRRNSVGRFIELKSFNHETIYDLQNQLNLILYQLNNIEKEVLQLLFYCLGEIMDNVLVHSGLNNGWVAAQVFPKSNQIRLMICDNGQGIHNSLTGNPKSKYYGLAEYEALDLCIQRGVTNGEGLGFGLFATSQFILHNKGSLMLYSGNHYLKIENGEPEIINDAFWKGTLVYLLINTNIPVDYQSIMPDGHTLPDDYGFFIEKYFGDDNELW